MSKQPRVFVCRIVNSDFKITLLCFQVFQGNYNQHTIVRHDFKGIPLKAQIVQFVVQSHKGWPAMRVEVYGGTQSCKYLVAHI